MTKAPYIALRFIQTDSTTPLHHIPVSHALSGFLYQTFQIVESRRGEGRGKRKTKTQKESKTQRSSVCVWGGRWRCREENEA